MKNLTTKQKLVVAIALLDMLTALTSLQRALREMRR